MSLLRHHQLLMSAAAAQASYSDLAIAAGPVFYYKFEEPAGAVSGTVITDYSGNSNHGQYYWTAGAAALSGADSLLPSQAGEKSSDFVGVLGAALSNVGGIGFDADMTFAWAMNADGLGGSNTGVIVGLDGSAGSWQFRFLSATRLSLFFTQFSDQRFFDRPGGYTGQTLHCVLRYIHASGDVELWISGVLTASVSKPAGNITTSAAVGIGGWTAGTNRTFNGRIDEFAYYDRQLSNSEIAALYAATGL